jgi:UDP-N-acetylmuramyl tripeptide synthase
MRGIQDRVPGRTSLRAIFQEARFIHADDVWGDRCWNQPESCLPGDIYVVAPMEDHPDQAAARAVARGAVGVVTERLLPLRVPQCIVQDVSLAFSRLTDAFEGSPGKGLLTIGVVGRHGKTSAVVAIAAVLRGEGLRTAYRCDLGASDGVKQGIPVAHRAGPAEIVKWIKDARAATAAAAVIELSSSSLACGSAIPAHPDMLVATDGLDRNALSQAVALLPDDGVIVANESCPKLREWLEECDRPVLRFGTESDADVTGSIFCREPGEMTLLVTAGKTTAAMRTKLTGKLLAGAQLAGVTVGLLVGGKLESSVGALERLQSIPGRMQRLTRFSGPAIFLDAASDAARLTATCKAVRGELTGPLTCLIMLPREGTAADRAALARSAELSCRTQGRVIVTALPDGRSSFLRDVHDALDGFENPVRHLWIPDWKKGIRNALDITPSHGGVLICCPRESTDGLRHRALCEQIALEVAQV